MKFGKFFKKAVKLAGKIAKPILEQTPGGKLALRAQQTLKSLGGNLKAARLGKLEPLSVRGAIEKVAPPAPPRTLKRLRVLSIAQRSTGKGSRMPQEARTVARKGKRLPPAGGLDLRAMAAQWRAAGKPGSWREWIRSNPIRKAG